MRQHSGDPGQLLFQLQLDGRKDSPELTKVQLVHHTGEQSALFNVTLIQKHLHRQTQRIHDQVHDRLVIVYSQISQQTLHTAGGGHWV